MVETLVALHALLGELGVFAFLLVVLELISPTEKTVKRTRIFALAGTILIFASWIFGGYYYIADYGPNVKPAIKEGTTPWVHSVIMEAKEHIFLFMPFLAVLVTAMAYTYASEDILNNDKIRLSIIVSCALIILLGAAIALMGYVLSAGARISLEGGVG